MVTETAEEILGVEAATASKDDIAVAFWLKTEEVDKLIIDTDDQEKLGKLLEEKDQLLEARALLEGLSIHQIRKEMLEKKRSNVTGIDPRLLLFAVIIWLFVMGIVFFAIMQM